MRKITLLFVIACFSSTSIEAQTAAKSIYGEVGGPGIFSINFDTRFSKQENGFGMRVGIGGIDLSGPSFVLADASFCFFQLV